jgi:hypothetical protein
LENCRSVDQRTPQILERIGDLITDEPGMLAGQGSVVKSWRYYRGRRLGPYYRLSYRAGGCQHAIYLGADEDLADEIRQLLSDLQKKQKRRRTLARIRKQAKKSLAVERGKLREELEKVGLRLKGAEIRGLRGLPGRCL